MSRLIGTLLAFVHCNVSVSFMTHLVLDYHKLQSGLIRTQMTFEHLNFIIFFVLGNEMIPQGGSVFCLKCAVLTFPKSSVWTASVTQNVLFKNGWRLWRERTYMALIVTWWCVHIIHPEKKNTHLKIIHSCEIRQL